MKYLKSFNEVNINLAIKKQRKALILHGYEGHPYTDWIEQLKSYDIIAKSPKIDYDKDDSIKDMQNLIEREKFDLIIGHSLGGLVAIYFSNVFKIQSLVFNPAIGDEWFKYLDDNKLTKPFTKNCCNGLVNGVVCLDDSDILPDDQIKFLNLVGANINTVEDVDHDIPDWVFSKYLYLLENR